MEGQRDGQLNKLTFEVDLSVLARWLSARWDEFDSICAATPVDYLSVFLAHRTLSKMYSIQTPCLGVTCLI